jgi:transcriptional regulator with XRE-family HTH domain
MRIDEMVGRSIRFRRLQLSLSTLQLANAANIPTLQIDDFEAGLKRVPASNMLRLCRVLDVQASYFFEVRYTH